VTLLVVGGSGYLGRELLRRAPDAIGISSADVDIRSEAAVAALFERLRPQAVINTAYRRDDRATTFDGAVFVARAAAATGARLVQLSTDLVFDGEKGSPYVEEDHPAPLGDYGRAKADAERAVLEACPGAAIVRTSLLYGGADPGPQERLAADPSAAFFTDELRCPIQVGDLAAALLELAATDYAGLLHVAGADRVSRHEFAELLTGGPVRAASLADASEVRPRDCSLSVERAQALLRTRLRGARAVLKDP
jgi:dTDP-4-dehydrorhamnose reductase